MTRWYTLTETTDDDFLTSAPLRTTKVLDTSLPAEELWQYLTADDALVSWSPAVTGFKWTTPRPFGVGTERELTIGGGAVKVREHFYRWEEGKRKSFYVAASTRPGINRFAEDYIVESTPGGSRLTWVVAVEPKRAAKVAGILGGPVLSIAIGQMANGLKKKIKREHGKV